MELLLASSELLPIAKVGGLADTVAALAKTLCLMDHRVTVALPSYRCLQEAGLMLARRLSPLRFAVGKQQIEAFLYDGRLGSGVELLLIDIDGLYDRPGIYGADEGQGYPDNARRFGLFCRALLEVIVKRAQEGAAFDAVHAHDWPLGLLPFLLRDQAIRTVLTVHDASHQGLFPREALDEIGLSWEDFHPAGLEYYGQLNMLKAGVLTAGAVTTVSRSYARELCTPAGGAGLDGVFRARGGELLGIVNGLDYAIWSPAVDPHIAARYDAEDAANKSRCKAAFTHELGLSFDPARPLLAAHGPLSWDKGSDLLLAALPQLLRTGAQIVVAGAGDPQLAAGFEQLAGQHSDDFRFVGRADDEGLSHRLIAAADLVLVPSRHEPCGTLQLCGQRYGSLPVAHAADGLIDTIVDCDARCETGTGFLFEEPTAEGLIGATVRALAALRTEGWADLRRRVMRLDLSWERPARQFAKLFQQP